jgi:hypothetical protein
MERHRRNRTEGSERRERRERSNVPEMKNLLSQMDEDIEKVDIESPNGEELFQDIISRKRNDEKTSRDRRITSLSAGSSSRTASGVNFI